MLPIGFGSGCGKIRCIQIIFTSNPEQREQGIAPNIGRPDAAVRSRQSGRPANQTRSTLPTNAQAPSSDNNAGRLIDPGRLYRGDLMLAQSLAYDLKTSGKRRLTELPCAALAGRGSMVPISDFSGLGV